FSVVGLALYGLPFYYDFMVRELGWSPTMVTSGNAISKLVVGPLCGLAAGWIVDRFGPRRLMMAGILMAGGALVGLGAVSAVWSFYVFYFLNALGYVCGGPLPCQVLLSRWFDKTRGKAMGIAYLGIGIGGTNQHLKLFLSLDRGYAQNDAARIISLVLGVSIAGRLLMGWLADRMPRKQVMLIIYVLVAGAIPLLLIPAAASAGSAMFLFAA